MNKSTVFVVTFLALESGLNLGLARQGYCFGADINATTHEGAAEASGAPSMVSTSSRGLFMVRDNLENDCFDVMRSSDGGLSWYQFFWYCGGGSALRAQSPSIAVPELKQDYMYVAFTEQPTEIRLLKVDLNNPTNWSWTTIASVPVNGSSQLRTPKLITDGLDYVDNYYVYLSYVRSSYVGGVLTDQAANQVSYDKGTTWRDQHIFANSDGSCDIAYANNRLYMAYTDRSRIYVASSPNFGYSWNSPTTVALAPNNYRYGWPRPRVAAIHDSSVIAVVYGSPEVAGYPDGVWYAVSANSGSTWTGGQITAKDDSFVADLTAEPSLGSFHLAFLSTRVCQGEFCFHQSVEYSSASYLAPTLWSAPVKVSDGTYYVDSPSITVDWASNSPGIAWRSSGYRGILFDRKSR